MTWARVEHDCVTPASRTIEADGLLVSSNGRRGLHPLTLECVGIPNPPRVLNGTEAALWTGSELIAWGGARQESPAPRLGGSVYRPGAPDAEWGRRHRSSWRAGIWRPCQPMAMGSLAARVALYAGHR